MTDAFIYDAIRSPRGKGRKDGALHEVTSARLSANILNAVKDRNGLEGHAVEDVIWGNVTQVGEQGGCLARTAVLASDLDEAIPGLSINRFCASGLEAVNLAANQVRGGAGEAYIAGGVEMMGRVPMGSDGAAIAVDPSIAMSTYFVPQGISADLIATTYGFSRDDADALAVESQRRAKAAWDDGRFARSVVPVKDQNGLTILDHDEYMRPGTDMQALGALNASFREMGEVMPGFDAVALMKYPQLERINHIHHAGNSSGIVDGAAAVLIGSAEFGKARGLTPRGQDRHRSDDDADRPGAGDREDLARQRHGDRRHRPVRGQRGLRQRRSALHAGLRDRSRQGQCQWRRHRHGPSPGRHRGDHPRHASG
jgi:acetyl-CoA C-acetyltransferase